MTTNDPLRPDVAWRGTTEYDRLLAKFECPVCEGAIAGEHYHRETADGEEVIRPSASAPQVPDVDRLAEFMWDERQVLDAGIEGFNRKRYQSASKRIVARLSREEIA